MRQIHAIADAGGDLVRCAVPREKDVDALSGSCASRRSRSSRTSTSTTRWRSRRSTPGAHCIRINPGNIGGHEKIAEVADKARAAGVPIRIGVNSGSLPKHLHELERSNPVEALVEAAVEYVDLMERLDFEDFKVSIKSTSVPNTIAANRLLSAADRLPAAPGHHRGGHQVVRLAQVRGRPGTLLADGDRRHHPHLALHLPRGGGGQGRREILKALELRERGPVLIACPTCAGCSSTWTPWWPRSRPGSPVRRPDRGRGAGLRGQRHRRGLTRGLRHHGAKNEGLISPTASRCGRSRRSVSWTSFSQRSTGRWRSAASRWTSTRPPRAPPGSRRSKRRTPAS